MVNVKLAEDNASNWEVWFSEKQESYDALERIAYAVHVSFIQTVVALQNTVNINI